MDTGNKQILIAIKAGSGVKDILKTVQSFDAVPLAQIAISYGQNTDALTILGASNRNNASKLTTVGTTSNDIQQVDEQASTRKDTQVPERPIKPPPLSDIEKENGSNVAVDNSSADNVQDMDEHLGPALMDESEPQSPGNETRTEVEEIEMIQAIFNSLVSNIFIVSYL